VRATLTLHLTFLSGTAKTMISLAKQHFTNKLYEVQKGSEDEYILFKNNVILYTFQSNIASNQKRSALT
jgi:hypothetical protein